MRLINVDEIRIKPEYMHDICGVAMIRVEDIARIINDMPTIQSECKKGEWIEIKYTFHHKCSNCEWINNADSGYNFCPNCGCRMEEGEQE